MKSLEGNEIICVKRSVATFYETGFNQDIKFGTIRPRLGRMETTQNNFLRKRRNNPWKNGY